MIKTKGTKDEVYKGIALKTSGGLKKEDLLLNARNKVVSAKQHNRGISIYDNMMTKTCEKRANNTPSEPKPKPKPRGRKKKEVITEVEPDTRKEEEIVGSDAFELLSKERKLEILNSIPVTTLPEKKKSKRPPNVFKY